MDFFMTTGATEIASGCGAQNGFIAAVVTGIATVILPTGSLVVAHMLGNQGVFVTDLTLGVQAVVDMGLIMIIHLVAGIAILLFIVNGIYNPGIGAAVTGGAVCYVLSD